MMIVTTAIQKPITAVAIIRRRAILRRDAKDSVVNEWLVKAVLSPENSSFSEEVVDRLCEIGWDTENGYSRIEYRERQYTAIIQQHAPKNNIAIAFSYTTHISCNEIHIRKLCNL